MRSTRENPAEPEVTSSGQKKAASEILEAAGNLAGSDANSKVQGAAEVAPGGEKRRGSRRWLLAGTAGTLLIVCAGFAAYFLVSAPEAPPRAMRSKVSAKLPEAIDLLAEAAEPLPDFLVPLPTSHESVVLRLSLALHWRQEVRAKFLQRRVAVRSAIYHRLREIIASGMVSARGGKLVYRQKADLEGEITRIFVRELGQRQLVVTVKRVDFL